MAHWKRVERYAACVPSPLEHAKELLNQASGILILDGTYVSVRGEERCIHIAYDTSIGVVDYFIDDTENKTAYGYIIERLKKIGYVFKCVVSDGHFSIVPIVDEENYPHQRCLYHVLKNLYDFLSQNGELAGGNGILYSRLKYILKAPTIEDLDQRIIWFLKYSKHLFKKKKQKSALRWLWQILPQATIHLCFFDEKVPRTSGMIENLNGQIKARLKTFRGVKSEKSLHNLLKILFRFRNYK